MPILRPALAYAAIVFAAGFALGTLRVLLIAPRLGERAAVALALPVMLALSWLAAGWVLRRWPLPGPVAGLAMGALAFAVLLVLELATGVVLFGRSLPEALSAMLTPPGLFGLAAQIGFALAPTVRIKAQP